MVRSTSPLGVRALGAAFVVDALRAVREFKATTDTGRASNSFSIASRSVVLRPHRDAPVGQHPFEVAVADRKLQVPAHGPEDHLGREAKAAECAGGVMTVLSAECWREHRSYPGTTAPLNATDPRGQLSPFAPAHQASFAPRSGPNLTTPKPDKERSLIGQSRIAAAATGLSCGLAEILGCLHGINTADAALLRRPSVGGRKEALCGIFHQYWS